MAQATIPARGASTFHLGGLGIAALVVIVALVAGLVGYLISENQGSPVNPDQALVNDHAAAVSSATTDPAKIAAIYATDATIHDMVAGTTYSGIEAIQATIASYPVGFTVTPASDPVRNGDMVAVFTTYGEETTPEAELGLALVLMQVEDGKIQNQWMYSAAE